MKRITILPHPAGGADALTLFTKVVTVTSAKKKQTVFSSSSLLLRNQNMSSKSEVAIAKRKRKIL